MTKTELQYNPLDSETLNNPYPIYHQLRENSPVFWHEGMKSWVLTRYEDCREVLRNHELFARDLRRIGVDIPDIKNNLQTLDPPANMPLRNLMIKAFNSQDIESIRRRVHDLIEDIYKKQDSNKEFDFMKEVSAPLSLSLTCILLGIEEPDLESIVEISDAIAYQMDSGLVPENAELGNSARKKLNELVEEWLAAEEQPGILSYIRKNSQKANIPEHYVRNTTGTMFTASFGTLYASFGNALLVLLEHPDILDQFKNQELLDSGVDELIRFDGPATGTSRFAVEETKIGETIIKPGEIVLTLLAAANRDPEVYLDPDRIILNRSAKPNLGFGWGPHSCVGTLFGKLAIQQLIVCLLESPRRLQLVSEPKRRNTATVRCIDVLPVSFN
ncbi:cytochrome P450 [Lysinibacillus sp. NPDC086135]|uniref:cytochrome P450 n=1 Tax=Lysinibacillus sp. NPDC086135 TaxID=3364130 RepID=UPI003806ED66